MNDNQPKQGIVDSLIDIIVAIGGIALLLYLKKYFLLP